MLQYKLQRILIFTVLGFFAKSTLADIENRVSTAVGTEWNSNVYKSASDHQSDTIGRLLVDLNLSNLGESTDYGISYKLLHEEYLDDSFDSRNYYSGLGYFNMTLIPSRLSWNSEVGSSVTLRAGDGIDLPSNRDQRNSYSTALDYSIISNKKDALTASATLSRFEFREANQNGSDRGMFELEWKHAISKLTSGGLLCDAEKVEFKVGESYDAFMCGVTAARRLSNGLISAELGKKTIDPEGAFDTESELVYSIQMNWASGPNTIKLQSTKDLVDTSVGLFKHQFDVDPNEPLDQNTDIVDITLRSRTQIYYGYAFSAISELGGSLYVDSDERYNTDRNNDRKGVRLNYKSRLTRSLNFNIDYEFERKLYASNTPDSRLTYTNLYTISLDKTFSRHFQLIGRLQSEDRRSNVDFDEYELYAFIVDLFYTF